mgnify:CR=1 FL=1
MSAPQIMEPSACTWCGIAERGHGRQYADAVGWHAWEQPSQEQILARMKARRLQLAVARAGALPMPVGGERTLDVVEEELTGVNLALWEEIQAYARLRQALASAKRGRARLRARIAELEAAQVPADVYPPAMPWAALMDAGDLADFLDELAASAITNASSDVALAEVEKTCATWRLIAEAQHGHNTAPGPDGEEPYVSRLLPPRDAICARTGCGHRGEDHYHGGTTCWAHLPKQHGDPITLCECQGFVAGPSADEPTRLFPTVGWLREVPSGETDPARRAAWRMLSREEPHDSPLHQNHLVPHDLPVAADLPVPEGCRLSPDELDEVSSQCWFSDGGV